MSGRSSAPNHKPRLALGAITLVALVLLSGVGVSQCQASNGGEGQRHPASAGLGGGAGQADRNEGGTEGWQSLNELARGRIGVILGTLFAPYIAQAYPQAQVSTFNSTTDQVVALKTGKVDTAIFDAISARAITQIHPELGILEEGFLTYPLGIGFRRDRPELRQRFNRFLEQLRAKGGYEEIYRRWLVEDPEQAVMPDYLVQNPQESYVLGVSAADLPYVALKDGRYVGLDIEILQRFGAEEGIGLDILPLDFGALIPALASGKVDIITDGIAITEERSRAVDFSAPYAEGRAAALALTANLAPGSNPRPAHSPSGTTATVGEKSETGLPSPGSSVSGGGWRSLDDLARGRIAVFAGAIQDQYVVHTYPEAQIIHLNGHADLITSLKTAKVDAGIIIATSAPEILKANPEIGLLGKPILPVSQAVAFRQGDQELRERFDRFMATILADGTHADMHARWFEADAKQARMPDIPLPETGPVLRLGTSVFVGLPYVGMVDGNFVGFDIELARRFAAHEGMRLELTPLEFSSLIPALLSGKLDLIASALAVTEERQKQVAFSTPYAEVSSVTLALKRNLDKGQQGQPEASRPRKAEQASGPLAELRASFYANFVLEQRWRLILHGLWATLLISVASTLFGTLLGALICYLRMSSRTLPRLLGSGYIALIRGLPVLLLLMLIYYVAFASVNIDPLIVAVIAFGMNFAAYVSEMFRTGIEGVDRGQSEAGLAMGFTRIQTFWYLVLPQATRRTLPVYRGEFIALVKMTSIVGYIGVQDLTKAGDIIRSRTFEAFFPLLMVAAIYFLIIWGLGLALDEVDRRTDPKRRAKAGVETA